MTLHGSHPQRSNGSNKLNYFVRFRLTVLFPNRVSSFNMSGDCDSNWEKYLTPQFAYVINHLQPLPVLDKLKEKRLISNEEFTRLSKSLETKSDEHCNRKLLAEILPKNGPHSFKEFLGVLEETGQQHIAERLIPEGVELFEENRQGC